MTTPHVTELPRRLEATSPDTFLSGAGADAAPLAPVVSLGARAASSGPRAPRPRRGSRPSRPPAGYGPGDDAA
ncbi:MAG: hypothetical protein QOJ35_1727 [Solirubrobacteraceae bacterium]|jgi:hypothetical protein|nr:hypothetical protein [Solirubrobacteraceae bacterium]